MMGGICTLYRTFTIILCTISGLCTLYLTFNIITGAMSGICTLHLTFTIISGTMMSGLCTMCCGRTRVDTKDNHIMQTVCVNMWVGFAQLFTVTFMLVGWVWSLAWGIYLVILAGMLGALHFSHFSRRSIPSQQVHSVVSTFT